MKNYQYLDDKGTFCLNNPESTSYLYFPIANESGVMSSLTPYLGGDSKIGQHNFLLEPVSSENLHNNKSTRNFWAFIHGKGAWSATGVSSAQQASFFVDRKDRTQLQAGIMWHKVSRYNEELGISSTITSFVPSSGVKMELMEVVIKNISNEAITITPTAAIPIYGRSADNIRDHRHVTSLLHRIKTNEKGVIVNPTLAFDERGHQKNKLIYGVFGNDEKSGDPQGFYPIIEDFIGSGGSLENPEAIIRGNIQAVNKGYSVDGYEALGGIRFCDITLEPGKENTYIIAMGYGTAIDDLSKNVDKFLSKTKFNQALSETKKYWNRKVNVSYKSGDSNFDNWMYWVNFQPMLRRIYGCSFLPHHDYGKGGRGWRDLWQDCLALLIMNPNVVREMLVNNFAGIRIDGTNATIIGRKAGEFIADRNNITRVWMDHGVWPLLTTKLYIEQSGDFNLLLEDVTYFKDMQVHRGEEKDFLWSDKEGNYQLTSKGDIYQGSILEHILLQNLTAFYDVGEHNHIRLRGADWNDALDMAIERGESVAFTSAYAGNLIHLADLIDKLSERAGIKVLFLAKEILPLLEDSEYLYNSIKSKIKLLASYYSNCSHTISGEKVEITSRDLSTSLRNKGNWIKNHIRSTEWITDKAGYSWFNGYYDNNGNQVEGDHALGTRMMLTGQVFTIMSKTATREQTLEIIKAADRYLYKKEIGGYRLNTDFNEVKTDLGRMFGFAYGHKENGAVFCHMTVMYGNALYQRGFVRQAYKVINTLYKHLSNFEISKVYPGITEYISEKGTGLYHYLTGSASWLLLTVITQMYGVKGKYGDLALEPKLLKEQFDQNNQAAVSLVFANKQLHISYENKERKEYDEYKIEKVYINEVLYSENSNIINIEQINNLDSNKEHKIKVILK